MAGFSFFNWFRGGTALAERVGDQFSAPSSPIVSDLKQATPDTALQIATVWACIDRRASLVASLPFFTYNRQDSGQKTLARDTRLYSLLHDSPNSRMTPFEFWRAMIMNYDLRGNAYARIERDGNGEALALWPMPADQVNTVMLENGNMLYEYNIGGNIAILSEKNVLHIKNLGNGTTGLAKLEFMRPTLDEVAKMQDTASKLYGTNGKPTGLLMIDKVLNPEQREAVQNKYSGLQSSGTGRLMTLEASMEYKQLSMSPEQMQLLESRAHTVEEICRWYDVPPVLIYHSNVTTWGSGVEQIIDGFYKLVVRSLLVSVEQAVTKRVMTANQRSKYTVEHSLDALLRGSIKDRYEAYKTAINYSIMTSAECRQLENLPPIEGSDVLMIQANMVSLANAVKGVSNATNKETITN